MDLQTFPNVREQRRRQQHTRSCARIYAPHARLARHGMQRHAPPAHRDATPRRAMPRRGMLRPTSRRGTLRHAMPCHALPTRAMPRRAALVSMPLPVPEGVRYEENVRRHLSINIYRMSMKMNRKMSSPAPWQARATPKAAVPTSNPQI